MPRLNAALLGGLIVIVLVIGVIVVSRQQDSIERLEEIACLERIEATAAVTDLVPEANVDEAGRLDAVRLLSAQLDACGLEPLVAP